MSASNPSFLLVVATHNRPSGLKALLSALRPQVEENTHRRMVVVNDGTHDTVYESVVAPHRAWLDYKVLEKNCGPGGARQYGCDGSDEDYIIFTDDDCVPPPWWLDRAEALAQTYPTIDLFSGRGRRSMPTHKGMRGDYQKWSQIGLSAEIFEADLHLVPTAVMMVRRSAFDDVGGFSDVMKGAAEDRRLTQDIMLQGCSFLDDPFWTTTHHAVSSPLQIWRRMYGYGKGNTQQSLIQKNDAMRPIRSHFDLGWDQSFIEMYRRSFAVGFSSEALVVFFIRLISVIAYRKGAKNAQIHLEHPSGPSKDLPWRPEHSVAELVVEGAADWHNSFRAWRQSQAN